MKLGTILGTLLSIALLCSAASAATENKDLPTQSEVSTFVGGLAPTGNYADSVSTAATAQHPTWKWDIWTDAAGSQMISFYYSENSAKGYGSMYYNELGQVSGCTGSCTLVRVYTGSEQATVTETPTTTPIMETPAEAVTEAPVVETPNEAVRETPIRTVTGNEALPAQREITSFVSGLATTNFVAVASEASLKDHPTWKWDTWVDSNGNKIISFYYSVDSAKGYSSIYYDDSGEQCSQMSGSYTLVKSYTGEAVQDATVTETKPVDISTEALVVETVTEAIVAETTVENTTPVEATKESKYAQLLSLLKELYED